MKNEWKEIINYRNIAHLATGIITILLVLGTMALLGQLALDTLHVYAYWLGFAACIIALTIMQIFWEIMKLAEQGWKEDSQEISEDK